MTGQGEPIIELSRMCDRLTELIERDELAIGDYLAGEPLEDYRELLRREDDALGECRTLLGGGW